MRCVSYCLLDGFDCLIELSYSTKIIKKEYHFTFEKYAFTTTHMPDVVCKFLGENK
jgi:hypothetical protein